MTPGTANAKRLQAAIDAGEIRDFETLLAEVDASGGRLNRSGDGYIGIRYGTAKVRVRFCFPNPAFGVKARPANRVAKPSFVYALLVTSPSEKACYIGCTRDLSKRMAQHAATWLEPDGYSSSHLAQWAAQRGLTDIRLCLLAAGTSHTQPLRMLESACIAAAWQAGYETPGWESWAPRFAPQKDRAKSPFDWDDQRIRTVAVPLLLFARSRGRQHLSPLAVIAPPDVQTAVSETQP